MTRLRVVLAGILLPAGLAGCDFLTDLTGPEETGAYGHIEVYSRTSTSWTDRLPETAMLDVPESSASGSGIGVGAANSETGVIVTVANVDPESPCAVVGRTCAPVQGSSTMVMLSLLAPGAGVAQWVAVDGEVTVESINPTRFRLDNVQMRVAPYEGNQANGSFNLRGVVGPTD